MPETSPGQNGLKHIIRRNKVYILISLGIIALIIAIIVLAPGFSSIGQRESSGGLDTIPKVPDTTVIRIDFLGDMMGHMPVINSGFNAETGRYDYAYCLRFLKLYFEKADLVVGNLETTLNGPPYTGFPMFTSPDDYVRSLRDNGIHFMVTANNHSYDRGKSGIERTIKVLDSLKIEHTGTFADSAERAAEYPYFKEIKGLKFCFLNYTYGTNGLTVYPPSIVNDIDSSQMKKDMEKAKAGKPDYIIVVLHWGVEYARQPSYEQQGVAQYLTSLGADAIIGAHPHVLQTVEFIQKPDSSATVPVVYSMGNFLSNQRDRYKDGGLIASLTFKKSGEWKSAPSLEVLPFWVYKKEGPSKYYLIPDGILENQPGLASMSATDREKAGQFFSDTRKLIPNAAYVSFYRQFALDTTVVYVP